MTNIFTPRLSYRPSEYTQPLQYIQAIQRSYWIFEDFDYSSDVQDIRSNMNKQETSAALRSVLGISHTESDLKLFWVKLKDFIPKPEFAEVGIVFGESEVRHAHAYSELLNLLSLNTEFSKILEVPAFSERKAYMDKSMANCTGSNQSFIESVVLFTLFVENVSLFSQFLIISCLNKDKGYLKGITNAVSATALEENIHALLGTEIINIVRNEFPHWFNEDMQNRIYGLVQDSFKAECKIIDWIFEKGEISCISKKEVVEYVKHRYNIGLEQTGFKPMFKINDKLLKVSEFFDLRVHTTSHMDFFHKRSINYSKNILNFDPHIILPGTFTND